MEKERVTTDGNSRETGGVVVITGAAAGIGKALVERFLRDGRHVVGIDHDFVAIERTAAEFAAHGALFRFEVADLADGAQVERLVERLATGPVIDVLVHNAGINQVGRFEACDLAAQRRVLDVNLLAPLVMTARLLERGKLQRRSSLAFVSSLSHFLGYPAAATYAASKDGLASFARSLSVSLLAQDVHVLTVFPGPTRTEHARRHSPDNSREHRRMDPSLLADRIVRAVDRRRRILIPGFANQLMAALGLWAPALAELGMKRAILDPLDRAERSPRS